MSQIRTSALVVFAALAAALFGAGDTFTIRSSAAALPGATPLPRRSVPLKSAKPSPTPAETTLLSQPGPSRVPVLTFANAPQLAVCNDIVSTDLLNMVNSAVEDPGVLFERNRQLHPHMIMMPPTTACASALWRSVHAPVTEPVDLELISSRQYSPEAVFAFAPFAASVGTNVDLSSGTEGYQGENNISIDPNNPQHMIAHSNTFFRDTTPACQSPTGGSALTFGTMSLYGSSDGGQTWKYNCAPWHTAVTGGVISANAYFGSDPALAWDGSGNAYACYMLLSTNSSGGAGASIVVAKSTDVGQTWTQLGSPVVNRIGVTANLDDKQMMAIDTTTGQAHSFTGRMYVIWDEGNVERVAHSDNGTTWVVIQPNGNTSAIGGNIVIGADGTVYIIWSKLGVSTDSIIFSKSIDGGSTWSAPLTIATQTLRSFGSNNTPPVQDQRGINGFGSIDIDNNPSSAFFGNLYVSFSDFPSGTTTGPDINTYVIRSTNGGTSWGTRLKVNDDGFGASQIFPWLAVDQSDGTVNVAWLDTRIDPLNRKTQAVYSRSSDGGVSFEPNLMVTDNGAAFRNNVNYSDESSVDNATYNGNQYGDYTGIAALNRQVHPLWTDSRMFFPLTDTQSPTRREDNATSVITNCSAPVTINAPTVNSSAAPSVAVSWAAPGGWGTNATNGTYSVYRNTTPTFTGASLLASGLTGTSYLDTTGVATTTYYYFVTAKNNCPGTALTPMSTNSTASAAVVFGSAGTPFGTLQGTVTSAGSPVSGVVVNAGSYSATTNVSGFYQLSAINANTYTVSAAPTGYSPASQNGVIVTDGATTVQNLALAAISGNSCPTDTTFSDFLRGSGTGLDAGSSPGDLKLATTGPEAADQSNTHFSSIGTVVTSTTWAGQTFKAGVTGNLTKISVGLGLNSGSTGTVTVEIHDISASNPGSTVLATATLGPVTNASGTTATYTTTFSSPAAVVSGTSYSVVIKALSGSVYVVDDNLAHYANGQYFSTTDSGGTWTGAAADMTFTEYVTPTTLLTTGSYTSPLKDSGSVTGSTTSWTTLSWNTGALPGGTALKFQAAASNSSSGPFNFVGPDGTGATFFTTTGASLAQFNGRRYLRYQGFFTGNGTNTPTLNDVTVCYSVAPTVTSAATLSVAGRVLTYEGAGLRKAVVSITDRDGNVRTTMTNGFGYYAFSDLATDSYILGVSARSYHYQLRALNLKDDLSGIDFYPVQ
jgi:hypothetical protein